MFDRSHAASYGWRGLITSVLAVLALGAFTVSQPIALDTQIAGAGAMKMASDPDLTSVRGTAVALPALANPTANIPENPGYPAICQSQPTGATCEDNAIEALNNARAAMGLAPYELPSGFRILSSTKQLLVLSNLDRALYGLAPIRGLTASLNAVALGGVTGDADPTGLLGAHDGLFYASWTANWSVGWASSLYTYYEWMYSDGIGGSNIDCSAGHADGCWGHRADTLSAFPAGSQIVMGVATGISPRYAAPSFTELYEAVTSGQPDYLTTSN